MDPTAAPRHSGAVGGTSAEGAGTTPRSNRTDEVLSRILEAVPEHGRVLVAVDGIGASGKSTFGAALAAHASPRPVVLLHVDDYVNPAHVRHARGRFSAEGFWLDTYDYHALISSALRPLGRDGSGRYRPTLLDPADGAGVTAELVQADDDALVVVEGTFLHRDELARFWDCSVFLDVSFQEANRRMAERGGLDTALLPALLRRYNGAQDLYFACARPWERASVVVDNTDVAAPAVIDPEETYAARRTRG